VSLTVGNREQVGLDLALISKPPLIARTRVQTHSDDVFRRKSAVSGDEIRDRVSIHRMTQTDDRQISDREFFMRIRTKRLMLLPQNVNQSCICIYEVR